MITISDLPTVNATLNGVCATLLVGGYLAIRRRRIEVHRRFMLAAFATSSLFLISYVTYHLTADPVKFLGTGWIRPVYFTMLITHVILAIVLVPLVLVTLIRALRGRFEAPRRLARWTLPIWLYVSVTGVTVYVALYHAFGAGEIVLAD